MARLRQYTKGNVSLLDKVVGTDVENQYNTINISLASIVDLAVQYFSTNGGGDAINQSLFSIAEDIENNSIAIASYNQSISTNTSNIAAITTRTETLESVFSTDVDGNLTISAANISNLAETVAAEGFASATQVNAVDSRVDNIIDGSTVLSTYATNTQLQTTESTLEGSIATTENNLTAAYEAYTDNELTNYSTTTATQGLISQATADMATSQDLTTLESTLEQYTDNALTSYSDTAATQNLITNATADMASASFVTNLAASLGTTDSNGNLTVSEAFANSVLNTETTSDFASAQSVTDLTTTVGDNTTSISTNATSITDIEGNVSGSYGVTVDANGSIAGLQLLSDGTTSSMKFAADQFKFTNGSGTLTPFSIDTVNNKINLTGDVVFSSGGNYGDSDVQAYIDTVGEIFTSTTTISGGQITTGLIKNSTYPHSAGHSGFSTAGMAIDLDNGSIHAEEFFVDSNGSSSFGGAHTAGSVGDWVVDSGGALKSSASSPAIVLSPGTYTEGTSEKIIISGVNLPTIAPSAGVSLEFDYLDYNYTDYEDYIEYATSSIGNTPSSGTPIPYIQSVSQVFDPPSGYGGTLINIPAITYTQDAEGTANNLGYEHPGGTLEFSLPYAASNEVLSAPVAQVQFYVQKEYLEDWGAQFTVNQNDACIQPRSNTLNKIGIIRFGYTVKLITKLYRGSSGDTATTVQDTLPVDTFTRTLDSGTNFVDLNDFDQATYVNNTPTEGTYPNENLTTGSNSCNVATYYFADSDFGSWNAGEITQGINPISVSAGKLFLISTIEYKITNCEILLSNVHQFSGYESGGTHYVSLAAFGGFNSSSLSGTSSSTALTQAVFKGGQPKINIGLNGTQVRGAEGYVALGDITSTDSIAQFWGDTEVVGVLTANSTATPSDERLKQNVKPIRNSLNTVKLLNPVTYNWNRNKLNVPGTKHGFIAQEVKNIIPSTVLGGKKIADIDDTLTVEYNNFIALNTSAIKELIEKIEALEAEIETLKQTNG